ncbi:hypothetical protein G5714_011546 [Onychostoma macrolepis]|uniref:Uncharacterized protein n=1 Tax=Onychostoma macrolepis TaxID=369639 RepID=A0A7J6CN34_9TELE|nr:hypothetical protein G5714_011546 [Onychostoma macrolepis]
MHESFPVEQTLRFRLTKGETYTSEAASAERPSDAMKPPSQTTYLFHPAAGESYPSRLQASISSQMTASASRPPNFTFSSPTLGKAYPSDTASIVLPSGVVSIELLSDVGESLPARQTYLFSILRPARLTHPCCECPSPDGCRRSLLTTQLYLSVLLVRLSEPRSFHLYLFDTVSRDLPSDAGESLPARQPYLFKSHAGDAYPSDTVSLDLPSGVGESLTARQLTASSYGRRD